jgi:ABC-type glycerol-3-phosphate transport system substrate-binding protein
MRTCIFLFAAAALLAACSTPDVERTSASAPTVTYRPQNEKEYHQAAEEADDYCDDHYDAEARASDLWPTAGGEVTFTCVSD